MQAQVETAARTTTALNSSGPVFGHRAALVPVLVSNLYSIFGVLGLQWGVADVFFWFWCEFVLAGITAVTLAIVWSRADRRLRPEVARFSPILVLFSFGMILIYATLFTALAYKGEWGAWARFPEFLRGKPLGLATILVSAAFYLVLTLRKPQRGIGDLHLVERQFGRRAWVILGIYAVLMFHYHWSGARRLELSPAYLKTMGTLLLSFKFLAEAGVFDVLIRRRRSAGLSHP